MAKSGEFLGFHTRYQLTGNYHRKRDASLFLQETTNSFSWEILCFFPDLGEDSCKEEKRNAGNYFYSSQPYRKIWQTQNTTHNNLVFIMVVTYME